MTSKLLIVTVVTVTKYWFEFITKYVRHYNENDESNIEVYQGFDFVDTCRK